MGNVCLEVILDRDFSQFIHNYNQHNGLHIDSSANLFKSEIYGKFKIVGRKESIYALRKNHAVLVWGQKHPQKRTCEAITMKPLGNYAHCRIGIV